MQTKNPSPTTKRKIPRYLSIGGQIAIFIVLFLAISAWQNRNMIARGQEAPHFKLKSADGQEWDLASYKGKRVILHFWATWCPVCKTNIPVFNFIAPFYKENPVFLSILVDGENRNAVERLIKEKSIGYPVLLGDATIAEKYQVNRYPTTYFLDKNGVIRSTDSGFLTPIGLWWRSWWLW